MATPLLSTKLYIPPARLGLVPRSRLIERLNNGLPGKLTLISAPAGFGKTTLLSEWIPHSPRCVTWVSSDEGDNDPTRFWVYFIGAVQKLQSNLGQNALILLQSPQPPPLELILTTLLNELATFPDDFALVLDDYHVIENPAIHTTTTFLLDHLLPQMHLIITTRADPPLPLSRLRGRGQLIELRVADLRFTPTEATAFLNEVMGLSLSAADVAALETQTEGWIAGLQLAALSMQGRQDVAGFIEAFTGTHRYILDYLTDEVLERRPRGTKNFLLQTSILDRLCGPLCDALTGGSDSQATLERLEQANLFIVPLDDERRWYRYHHLFAEVLQARLRQSQPDNVPELHRRAREWLEQNGLMHEAVNHALAGRDFEQAARLIELIHSAKWQTGEIKTLQSWLAALPALSWRTHPRLWLVQAWAAMTVGNFAEADEQLREAEEALAFLDQDSARSLRPEILAFRASYATLVQDSRAVELAQQALQELPQDYWMRGMLIVFLAGAYFMMGNLDAAAQVLAQEAGSTRPTLDLKPHYIHLLTFDGLVRYAKGKLREAWSLLHQAVDLAEPGGQPILYVGTLFAYMGASQVLYELDQLDQTETYLTRCAALAVKFGSAEVQVYALSGLARICLARDNLAAAANYFDQVDALLQTQVFTISIMAFVDYYRFQLLLKQGNLTAAAAWIESRAGQPGPLNPYAFHRVALPQILIAQGSFDTALDKLATLIQEAEITGHGSMLIKALVLQALAFHMCGNNSQALTILQRALTLAEPEGYVRAFVDEGAPMAGLLERMKAEGGRRTEYVLKLLAAFRTEKVTLSKEADKRTVHPSSFTVQPLIEPLTEREQELLHLVADGLTNQEIAQELFVAVGTVKKHINNIFGKLAVSNRTQAVARAREIGLL